MRIWKVLAVLLLLLGGGVAFLAMYRPGMAAYAAHGMPESQGGPGSLTATWFGVTAVLLRDGEHAIFIDPFFTRPEGFLPLVRNALITPDEPRIRSWLQRAGITHLDAVLVSHSHYDHAMDAGVVARLTGATLIGSPSTANIGRGAGLDEAHLQVVDSEEPITVGPFRITFIGSRHAGATGGKPLGTIDAPLIPPARYLDYKLGGAYSILVEHPRGSILHHGSAGFIPGKLRGVHADVVFLGIAIVDDLARYVAEVVEPVGATRVVPVHWDDFTRSLDRPLLPFPAVVRLEAFFEKMPHLAPGVQAQTLSIGAPRVLFAPPDVAP